MTVQWTKEDLSFLVEKMDKHNRPLLLMAADEPASSTDKIQNQAMSVPNPVTVNAQGDMTADDYKKCSFVMAVCQNMVQQTLTDAAKVSNVAPTDALKNMDAWVKAYVDFPFPFFNFVDTQSDTYHKEDFSIQTDPDAVERIVNIKNVASLKDAVLGALKSSGGNLASYSEQDRNFNYFGVVTAYNQLDISTRVVKFQMHMKTTKVDSLCVHYTKTNLDTNYDTYQFTADKELMIKMQEKMGDQLAEYMAAKLLDFAKKFYDDKFKAYSQQVADTLKKLVPS